MKEKGFTLIELLAVIVILAVIAIVATPIVLNVIAKTKKSSAQDSVYGVIASTKLAYTQAILKEDVILPYTVICNESGCKHNEEVIPIGGTIPTEGTFEIEATGKMKKTQDIKVNGYHCEITENEKVNCQKKAFDGSGGTTPDTPDPVIPEEPEKDITQQIEEKATEGELASIDPDHNLRYTGPNPNNYVSFNNELYRIIGVFDGQMKIIYWGTTSNPGQFYSTSKAWDSNVSNNWSKASLKTELNGTYWNTINETYRKMVDENHVWQLGGRTNSRATRATFYSDERRTNVSHGNPATWTGAVGLMYPSDWAYASNGADSTCGSKNLYDWDGVNAECPNKSWLHNWSTHQWTLTSFSNTTYTAVYANTAGCVNNYTSGNVNFTYGVRPVLYLKSDVKITSGSGTSSEPFGLS